MAAKSRLRLSYTPWTLSVQRSVQKVPGGHLRHGDIQLPACDFANVFGDGADTSNVVSSDLSGVTYSDIGFVARVDAGGVTPACPPGTF